MRIPIVDVDLSITELALGLGLASTICLTMATGAAWYGGMGKVLLTFPLREEGLETILGMINIIIISIALWRKK
jgi:hypothetical protein